MGGLPFLFREILMITLKTLLAGHPEDCSTCPKYGNCELQTLIQYIGANNARMRTRIKGIKMEEGNQLLIHDMNRCVLCGRCVRACNKLRGVGVLQYNKKELETYVGTLHGKLLKDEDCHVFSPFCSSFNLCRFDVHSVHLTSDIFLTCTVLLWYTVTIITDKIIT